MSTPRLLDVARASLLNARLRLGSVDVHRLVAEHLGSTPEPRLGYHLTIGNVSFASLDGGVVAAYPLEIRVHHKDETRTVPLAHLEVALRLGYQREGEPLSATELEALEHFLGIVGWMHAWPYARAEVQSLTTKLGFPPLLLPLLQPGATANVRVLEVGLETGEPHEDPATPGDVARPREG